MADRIITKTCTKCKENLPASAFTKYKRSRDGLRSQCRACQKANYWANREKRKEQMRANYWANRERDLERRRANYWDNHEREKEKRKVYRKENPEICKADRHRHRARKKNAEGSHTAAQAQARFAVHGDSCIYCASTQDLQVEHLKPLAKGGSNWPSNLAPACAKCNLSKQDKWGSDLLRWVEQNCMVASTKKILEKVLHSGE